MNLYLRFRNKPDLVMAKMRDIEREITASYRRLDELPVHGPASVRSWPADAQQVPRQLIPTDPGLEHEHDLNQSARSRRLSRSGGRRRSAPLTCSRTSTGQAHPTGRLRRSTAETGNAYVGFMRTCCPRLAPESYQRCALQLTAA